MFAPLRTLLATALVCLALAPAIDEAVAAQAPGHAALARDIFYGGTIILDRDGALDYRQVLAKAPEAKRQPRKRVPLDGNVYWVVADVENPSGPERWWVEVFAVRSDYVELFVLDEGTLVSHSRTGLLPLAEGPERRYHVGSLVLDFELPRTQKRTLLLRVQSRSLINYTIMAGPQHELENARVIRHFVVYLLLGGMLALLVYNMFLGVRLRDADYLFYSLHGLAYFAFFFNSYGLTANFLGFTNHPWITVYSALGICVTSTLFVWRFLRLSTWSPRFGAGMLAFGLTLVVVAMLAPVLGAAIVNQIWMAAYAVVAPLILVAAVRGVRARVRQAWYVLIGWTPMVAMTLLAIAAMAGLVQHPPPGAAINSTVLFEMLFLSLALADRVRQLRDERQRALEESAAKSSFLAILSHEVRTPLNGILGTIELLDRTRLSAQQQGFVATLRHAGQALMTLLDDVLDIARAEAGRIEIVPAPVDPRRLLESMVQLMRGRAEDKGLVIACHVDDAVPGLIVADGTRLRQVLLNLISNAVKFTDTGRIDVSLVHESGHDGRHRLRWEVRDTGIGIAVDEIGRLFERFVQIDASRTRRQQGVGLGLTICRELVQLMGGEIRVESKPAQGSRFWFTLEVRDADSTVSAVAGASGDATAAAPDVAIAAHRGLALEAAMREPMNVLVVDDVEMNRDVLGELLRHEGFRVHTVADGVTALAAVESGDFAAVVLDVYMPGMDGPAAARRLREQGSTVPIIGLTAALDAALYAECTRSGMDAVLTKPVSIAELSLELRRFADRSTDAVKLPVLDSAIFGSYRDSLGAERIGTIVRQFGERARAQMQVVGTSIERADTQSLARDAHRLAGMAASLGLVRLGAMAEEIATRARGQAESEAFAGALNTLEGALAESLEVLSTAIGAPAQG